MHLDLVNSQQVEKQRLESQMSPQRVLFVEEYMKTKSVTKAAEAALMPLEEATNIIDYQPRWFTGAIRVLSRDRVREKLEDGLEEILDLSFWKEDDSIDKDILRVKADMIKYGNSTLNNEVYNTKVIEQRTNVNINITQKLRELEGLAISNQPIQTIDGTDSRGQIEAGRQIVEIESSL